MDLISVSLKFYTTVTGKICISFIFWGFFRLDFETKINMINKLVLSYNLSLYQWNSFQLCWFQRQALAIPMDLCFTRLNFPNKLFPYQWSLIHLIDFHRQCLALSNDDFSTWLLLSDRLFFVQILLAWFSQTKKRYKKLAPNVFRPQCHVVFVKISFAYLCWCNNCVFSVFRLQSCLTGLSIVSRTSLSLWSCQDIVIFTVFP